ncbi:MAG: hypothetical protein BGO67_10940 [Alphaproteobacteria bacterium 41-28]|nr:MAG: hypothetical protein BGO67_10940 [Alphaproteobacteria bacterium 41-28]
MKALLTATMAFAVIMVLESTQPAHTIVTPSPTTTVYQQNHMTPVWWHHWFKSHHWPHWHHWHNWRWGW